MYPKEMSPDSHTHIQTQTSGPKTVKIVFHAGDLTVPNHNGKASGRATKASAGPTEQEMHECFSLLVRWK